MTARLRYALDRIERSVLDALLGPVEYRRPVPLDRLLAPYVDRGNPAPPGLRPWSQ